MFFTLSPRRPPKASCGKCFTNGLITPSQKCPRKSSLLNKETGVVRSDLVSLNNEQETMCNKRKRPMNERVDVLRCFNSQRSLSPALVVGSLKEENDFWNSHTVCRSFKEGTADCHRSTWSLSSWSCSWRLLWPKNNYQTSLFSILVATLIRS